MSTNASAWGYGRTGGVTAAWGYGRKGGAVVLAPQAPASHTALAGSGQHLSDLAGGRSESITASRDTNSTLAAGHSGHILAGE